MKKIFLLILSVNFFSSQANNPDQPLFSFTENKGQICDQNYKSRKDILFSGNNGNITFFLKNDGISYQLFHQEKKGTDNSRVKPESQSIPTIIQRVDINWLNSNCKTIIKTGELPGYNNYYLPSCENGALYVKNYSHITYKDLYDGIDLHYYEYKGQLKYDYEVEAGKNYKQIKLEIKGHTNLSVSNRGELIIETPLGNIVEQQPLILQDHKSLKGKWIINENVVTFEIAGLDKNKPFTIDPLVRTWGTFYGGNGDDYGLSCKTDNSSNIYLTGYTQYQNTGIATTGAFQVLHGGNSDAFLVKFSSNGVRLWGTYYGGAGIDYGHSLICDVSSNIYIVGVAGANGVFASPGCYQSTFGGYADAFLAKFNSNGVRVWGTFFGAGGIDAANGCCLDPSGNLHIVGSTQGDGNTFKIVTSGAYKTTYSGGNNDAFYAIFNASGNRVYCTYYGGAGDDEAYSCALDGNGDLYLTGITTSSISGIATIGSHQSIFGGGNRDAFLGKFGSNGILMWGTYYGGSGIEESFSCATDALNSVYTCGYTVSYNNISTPGCHQSSPVSSQDSYIAKFNSSGVRQWGTYYGSGNGDIARSCVVNQISGDIYVTGETSSFGVMGEIPTPGCHQDTLGGLEDAFLVKFNSNGVRMWGTYYGGNWEDWGLGIALDPTGNIYITGFSDSTSPNSISTPGCFQSMPATIAFDMFLAKFFDSGTTSIASTDNKESFQIFPNPTNEFLNFNSDFNRDKVSIEIVNILGQTVIQREISSNQVKVSELPPGAYILKLNNGRKILYSKFIKE